MKSPSRLLGCVLCAVLTCGALLLACAAVARAGEIGLVDGLWVIKKADERYEGDDVQEDLRISLDRLVKNRLPRNPWTCAG